MPSVLGFLVVISVSASADTSTGAYFVGITMSVPFFLGEFPVFRTWYVGSVMQVTLSAVGR